MAEDVLLLNKKMELATSKYLIFFKSFHDGKLIIRDLLHTVDYDIENINLDLLRDCKTPQSVKSLYKKYEEGLIQDYINKDILIDHGEMWNKLNIEQVEIEVLSTCNYKCRYCPVSVKPRKDHVMSMEIFNTILHQISELGTVKYVSFSAFNEPLLDPNFKDRIKILSYTNYKLKLSTNASLFSEDKVKTLLKYNVLDSVKINLPSIDKDEYVRLTGTDELTYNNAMSNIDLVISSGVTVNISVNGTKNEIRRNLPAIKEKYDEIISGNIIVGPTLDRAGCLKNEYHQNIQVSGKLPGWCFRPLTWLVFSAKGDIVLCANDYNQQNVFGNIKDGKIIDILNSTFAQNLRKQVYGELEPPNNFICRNCEYMKRGSIFSRFNPIN